MNEATSLIDIRNIEVQTSALDWLVNVFRIVKRKRYLLLSGMALSAGLCGSYISLADQKFSAATQLVIDSDQGSPFKQIQIAVGSGEMVLAGVDDQVQIISSEAMLRKVVRELDLSKDKEFQSFGHSVLGSLVSIPLSVMNSITQLFVSTKASISTSASDTAESRTVGILNRLIDVKRQAGSFVITIQVRTPSAIRSAQLANALAEAYLADQVSNKLAIAKGANAWLNDGIKKVREDALQADQAVQNFKDSNRIVDMADRGPISTSKLVDLNNSLNVAHARSEEARARSEQIDQILAQGIANMGDTLALSNPVIQKLRTDYLQTSQRLKDLRTRYGNDHLVFQQARENLKNLEIATNDELQSVALGLRNDATVAQKSEAAMVTEYDRLIADAGKQNKLRAELRDLASSAETYRSLYASYLQRYTQAIQDQAFPIPQARVFSRAERPLNPITNIPLLFGASMGLGLMLSAAGVLVAALFDRSLKKASDIELITGKHCLAEIAELSMKSRARPPALAIMTAAESDAGPKVALYGLAARLLRDQETRECGLAIGLIASTRGEGTTTLVYNLAALMAKLGHETLVVDLDIDTQGLSRGVTLYESATVVERATTQTNHVESNSGQGVVAAVIERVMSSKSSIHKLIARDSLTGLSVLRASHLHLEDYSGADSEGSLALQLRALRDQFKFIIYDVPAPSVSASFAFAERFVDTFLYVIRAGVTDQETVCHQLARCNIAGIRILGVILNRMTEVPAGD